jgi:hypothetical protein
MALLDRFRSKPEWQHPDPAVRAEAARHVPAHEQALLAALAREDSDPRVRRAAVKKLSAPETLGEILRSDGDEAVRQEAAGALETIALHAQDPAVGEAAVGALAEPRHLAAVAKAAALPSARRAAIGRISDPRALAAVAREADDAAIRLEAVSRLEDPSALGGLALKCEHKGVALAAVEKVSDVEALREIAERAKVGAAARRAAARLEERAGRDTPPAPAPAALDTAEEERAAAERRRLEDERAYARDARDALCRRVESVPPASAPLVLDEARAAWERLPPLPGPEAESLAHRFERACAEARGRHDARLTSEARRVRLAELCTEAERLAELADLAEARRHWSDLERNWSALMAPGDGSVEEPRARFAQAGARLRAREDEAKESLIRTARENAARLLALATRLHELAAAESVSLRDAERGLREAKEALESPGQFPSKKEREAALARLEAARKALYPRVQELRQDAEWKRWANVSVQEELCAQAEALLAATNLEEAARALHDLDLRWKQAAEAPKDRGEALWQRFRAARDQVRARCDAYFAQRDREWAENQRRKEALCERAEALAESTDWIRTAEQIQKLQAEWKQIGPVPHKQAKALWERFRAPCDRFFTRRGQDRKERAQAWVRNLGQKEALCAQVEALAESTEWEKAAAEIKRLQAEWRAVGPVKKTRSEAIWQRFRAGCDLFFDRYKRRDEIAAAAGLAAREGLCGELEALLAGEGEGAPPPPEDLVGRVQAVLAAWRQAGPPPTSAVALAERFASARDRVIAAHPDRFGGTELDPEVNRRKLEKLCVRVEALVSELEPRALSASGPDLAEQLRQALATNTIAGRGAAEARWQSAADEVEAARAAARRLGPVPGEAGNALLQRFEAACRRFAEIRPRATGSRGGAARKTAHS